MIDLILRSPEPQLVLRSPSRSLVLRSSGKSLIIRGGQGAPGSNASSGPAFTFAGLIRPSDDPVPAAAFPLALNIVRANCTATFDQAATSASVFLVEIQPATGGGWQLFATVTYSPTGSDIVLAQTTAPAGCRWRCVPPASPDPTLTGAAIFLGGV